MLARFAAALQRGHIAGMPGGLAGVATNDDGTVVVDPDNCTVQ